MTNLISVGSVTRFLRVTAALPPQNPKKASPFNRRLTFPGLTASYDPPASFR